MAENTLRASIPDEDRAIASIGQAIEQLPISVAAVSSVAAPPSSQEHRPSINAKRSSTKRTSATEARGNQKSPSAGNRPLQPSQARSRAPAPKFTETRGSSPQVSELVTEKSELELEQALRKLVQISSTSAALTVGSVSESGVLSGTSDTALLNFQWLMPVIAQRVAPYPKLSGVHHQFALLLVSLHHRDERMSLQSLDQISAFKVNWDDTTMSAVLDVLISDVSASYSPSSYGVHLDCLRALSLVLFDSARHYARYYGALLAALKPVCDARIVLDRETHRVAFNCIANMCYKSGSSGQSHYEEIWNLWMRQAALLQPQVLAQPSLSRVFSALLRGVQYIVPEAKHIHENGLPSLVSMLHKFIFYGTTLVGSSSSLLGTSLASSSSSSSVNSALSIAGEEKVDNFEEDDIISTGSEYSGSDVYNDKHGLWKVRFHALGCLQAVARDSGAKFVQFWSHLLPQSQHQPSLISIIQVDPVHQVRSAACRLISALFDGQSTFLLQASASSNYVTKGEVALESTPKKSATSKNSQQQLHLSPKSFTPMSMQVSNMLNEVHNGLYKALASETRQTTIVAIIKTIGVLAQESPYDALAPGIVTKFLVQLQKFATEKNEVDYRLRRTSISALASFAGAHISGNEVIEFLDGAGNLILGHFKTLLQVEPNLSIKTEVFRFFASLASKYPLLIIPHWNSIYPIVLETITGEKAQETDPNARYAASKVIDDLSRALLHAPLSTSPSEKQHLSAFTSELWQSILTSRITELMVKDRFGLVRGSVCNLFSQIPAPVFASLSRKHQVICITLLLGAVKDDVPAVRAQAARALGIYILNHALKVDPLFVSDVALALVSSMRDKNLNVRTKAAWSAANLCDALVTLREAASARRSELEHREGSQENFAEDDVQQEPLEDEEAEAEIPRETLVVLAKTLLGLCKDNDKVRCNVVRALGNFIRFAKVGMFAEGDALVPASAPVISRSTSKSQPAGESVSASTALLQQLVEAPLQLTREGSAKVRWNACYALANLFHNQDLVSAFQPSTARAIEALLSALIASSNFKVRINAVAALHLVASPGTLRSAPLHVLSILQAVAPQLQLPSNSVSDSTHLESGSIDSKYRDSLHEHLEKLVVGCFAAIAFPNASLPPSLVAFICAHSELLQATMESFLRRTQQEEPQRTGLDENPDSALVLDQDDAPLGEHSKLNPPTLEELKSQATLGIQLIRTLLPQ